MLQLRLDALAHHPGPQIVNHLDQFRQDQPRPRIDLSLLNQMAIQLHQIRSQLPQSIEVGVLAAEVIYSDAKPSSSIGFHRRL